MIIITCLLSQEKKKKLMQRYENVVLFFAIGIIAWSPPPPPCIAALWLDIYRCDVVRPANAKQNTMHRCASIRLGPCHGHEYRMLRNTHSPDRFTRSVRKFAAPLVYAVRVPTARRIHRDLHRKIIECTKVLFTRAQSEQSNKNTVLQWRRNMLKTYNLRTFLWKC